MAFHSTAINQATRTSKAATCADLPSSLVRSSSATLHGGYGHLIKPAHLRNRPCATSTDQKLSHFPKNNTVDHGTVTTIYTSTTADPLRLLNNADCLLQTDEKDQRKQYIIDSKNATHINLDQEQMLLIEAELRLLANAASDRAEMHSILARQRDNWNKLFQHTLTATSLTACVLSALANPAMEQCPLSFAMPALMLNAGTAAMMAIINQFQPSQLAEEQRTAVRLFSKVASDIQYVLQVAPTLRQHPPSFLRDCRRRLAALDKAFPMPLTPGGLEKFPARVVPPVLIEPFDGHPNIVSGASKHRNGILSDDSDDTENVNGWDARLIHDLEHVAELLHHSDISKYTGWAHNLVKVNKCLAIAAPLFSSCAALLNGALIVASRNVPPIMGMWPAVCSVMAVFASSLSNDMQMGMVFELYRNSAGYYANVEASIKETLNTPLQERENGVLFRQRIAYQLGRQASLHHPILPKDAEEAGTLF